ncbi:MAG: energy-coupling factor ABC transporter permease [Cellvibrionaceae bacterium]|nr:energy-coupling factor ABC transporter permease [Cellvibrionaceae bacterium]
MHIEPSVVDGAKLLLSYGTAAVSMGVLTRYSFASVRQHGLTQWLGKSLFSTLLVFVFFEVLPKFPVGISEVHFIFGSTLLLLFGVAPAAIGLTLGLLAQGLLFAPGDLPQFSMNVTTLLAPLFAMAFIANKVIPKSVAYKDLSYGHVVKLSAVYQGGIITWVAFWAFYGKGFGEENLNAVYTFALAYMTIVLVEPLIDMAVLFCAKQWPGLADKPMINRRLYQTA